MKCIQCGEREISAGPRAHDCCDVCAAIPSVPEPDELVQLLRSQSEWAVPRSHYRPIAESLSNAADRITADARRIAELTADAERLDFLQSQIGAGKWGCYYVIQRLDSGEVYFRPAHNTGGAWWINPNDPNEVNGPFHTIRAAIDTARTSGSSGE